MLEIQQTKRPNEYLLGLNLFLMTVRTSLFFLLLCAGIAISSCSRSILSLQDSVPTIGFRGIDLSNQQDFSSLEDITLSVGLKFLYQNPFNSALTIPAHQVEVRLNGDPIPGQLASHPGFTVPANGQILEIYPLELDLSPEGILASLDVLGKDNYLEVESSMDLDLSDLSETFRNNGLILPENELTDKLGLEEKLRQKLGTYTLSMAFGDTIRLPLLPTAGLSSRAASVSFLGHLDTLNLGAYQEAIVPFVDQLLTAELERDLMYPFIAAISELDCPAFPQPVPCIDMFSDAVTGFIQTAFAADPVTRANLTSQWASMMAEIQSPPEAGDPILDQVLSPLLPGVESNLDLLRQEWAAFKSEDAIISYPGSQVTGIRVSIPFLIHNPNEFAIDAPSLFSSAQLVNGNMAYSPAQFSASPQGGSRIPGGTSKDMRITMELSWGQMSAGFQALFSGKTIRPNLTGSTQFDFGYGPVIMGFDLEGMRMKMGN